MIRRLLVLAVAAVVAFFLSLQDGPWWALLALAGLAWGVLACMILTDRRQS